MVSQKVNLSVFINIFDVILLTWMGTTWNVLCVPLVVRVQLGTHGSISRQLQLDCPCCPLSM